MRRRYFVLLVGAALSGCGEDVTSSSVQMQFGSFSRAVTSAEFCLKRLRFKQDDTADNSSTGSDNVDFSPGLVSLSSNGTTIGTVTLPAGTYKRVEFDIEEDCDDTTQTGIEFTNDSGTGTSNSTTTVKFRGTFEANEASETLVLGIANIITALDGINTATASENDIRDALEAAGADGSLQ